MKKNNETKTRYSSRFNGNLRNATLLLFEEENELNTTDPINNSKSIPNSCQLSFDDSIYSTDSNITKARDNGTKEKIFDMLICRNCTTKIPNDNKVYYQLCQQGILNNVLLPLISENSHPTIF